MSNKMQTKIIFIVTLGILDIGFISRFSEYSVSNKIIVILFYAITIWIIRSIICEIKKVNLEKANYEKTVQETISSIRAGGIPKIESCSLILKDGEFACNEVQTYLTETKNKAVGSTGSGGGVSVRVTKGVYVRSSSGNSRKIYKDVTEKYFGSFIITNHRIVFMNNQKGFEIPYEKLTGLISSGKYLTLQSRNKSYTIFVNEPIVFEELIRAVAKL